MARSERELAHSYAATRREVQRSEILDEPSGRDECAVDGFAG
jgi:hypothetical protein